MRKVFAIVCVLTMSMALFAQASSETSSSKSEIIVFGAASLTESLTEIGNKYMAENPDVSIVFNFDSSGTLKTQIAEGAPSDIFISAAPRQMNELESLDMLLPGTRLDLLENKVVLAVSEGNPAGLKSFDDLAERLKAGNIFLAIGNSDVPVGQYTEKIFAYYGIDEAAVSSCLTYGSNVKEVTTQVAEGSVDCGIVYATDAFSAGLESAGAATAEMCGQVIYPAAVLKGSDRPEVLAFFEYLKSDGAIESFGSVGFSSAF